MIKFGFRHRRREWGLQSGFSVMEALVALAIIAIGLTAFSKAIGSSYRTAARLKAMTGALASARSHLDTVGRGGPLQEGVFTGSYANDMLWRLSISAISNPPRSVSTRPFWVIIEAFDRRGVRLVKLETAKISTVAP
jgi:prepilin-type N-terminal cleavage/methylation domain-containing protein